MVGHLFTGDFGPFSGILLFIVRLKNANHNSVGARHTMQHIYMFDSQNSQIHFLFVRSIFS